MVNPTRVLVLAGIGALALAVTLVLKPWPPVTTPQDAPVLSALYAAPLERVETHVLERGETLSAVLARAQITGSEFADLLLALREHLNPRSLGTGAEVTVRRWTLDDSPRAVEVRVNADSTLRLDREPFGWAGRLVITPTVVDTVHVAGVVDAGQSIYTTLLYNEAVEVPAGEKVSLVYDLDHIYGFKIDLSREIQPGDRYRFVYEREVRPDGSARSRRILVAELESRGRVYPAIYFRNDRGDAGYYDLEGRGLKSGFRKSPLSVVRVTSTFSWRRYHPILGVYRAHLGTDYGASHGTPVMATADGVVVSAGRNGGYGNIVVVRHFGGYSTRYAHLSRFAAGIRPGRAVAQEQVIGYVGATGLATAPHLHYEIRKDGKPLNPRQVRDVAPPTIAREDRDAFQRLTGERLALLEHYGVAGARLATSAGDAGAGASSGM